MFNFIEKLNISLKISFGGKNSKKRTEQKKVGVIDEGVNTTFIDCELKFPQNDTEKSQKCLNKAQKSHKRSEIV